MDWTKFNNHGESPNHAFEVMCNILFKCWLKKEYKDNISHFAFVNGSGGDGGVEAYGLLKSGDIIGVQSKWFPQKMEASQFKQIENSFYTAIKVRPELKRYIVCIPRDFTSKKMVKNNQVARDTEESKWINLCENINKEYPDVVIELWDETSIQLQYNYYGQGVRYISDYYEIDDFTNTYQDYVNSRYTKIEDKWIHTDQMVKTPYKEFSAENIEKWMKKKDTPDFTVWLGEKTDARILYAYTNIVNEVLGIEEAIWISSGIVKNNDFEKLIAEVNVYSEERSELLNVAEFHSYVETCGFYTPQEVCAVQSVKEANESINIGNEKNVIQVYKLVMSFMEMILLMIQIEAI